jgi:hypothetical protein
MLAPSSGVAGAGTRHRPMQHSQCRPVLGGHPRRRPSRRRASPVPFFLTNGDGLSVEWVVIGGVENAMWEGCYPALTLALTCGANRAS